MDLDAQDITPITQQYVRNTERLLRIMKNYPTIYEKYWAPFENKENISNMPYLPPFVGQIKVFKSI
jgi:hypothetical protein